MGFRDRSAPFRWRSRVSAVALALLIVEPRAASAHTEIRPTPDTLWSVWEPNPLLAIGMLALAWLYLHGTARLWRRAGSGRGVRRWQVWAFAGAMASIAIAAYSPLDALSGALFSAHMTQHLLVFLVAPLLLAISRPALPMLWALPPAWRRAAGRSLGRPAVTGVLRALNNWVVVLLLQAGVLWLWHVPSLYEAALDSTLVHEIEHVTFAAISYLFWTRVLSAGHPGGIGHGVALLMVFATALHSSALGALLTFADRPIYASHAPYTAAWGVTPLEDQQLAGVIMWVPMGLWFTVTALVLVGLWIQAAGESVRRMETERGEGQPYIDATTLARGRSVAPGGS